jgi:hypothetical protein
VRKFKQKKKNKKWIRRNNRRVNERDSSCVGDRGDEQVTKEYNTVMMMMMMVFNVQIGLLQQKYFHLLQFQELHFLIHPFVYHFYQYKFQNQVQLHELLNPIY